MNNKDINEILASLTEKTLKLEDAYIENGGEITEDTESLENELEDLKNLLLGDGVDSLGRWLKAKEDMKKTLKDEKAKIDAMMKATDNTIEYVKQQIRKVMVSCDTEQAKGTIYSFKVDESVTHEANTELIEGRYYKKLEELAKKAGLPAWLKLKISPSFSLVPAGVETDEFIENIKPTIKFVKPRKTE